MKKNCIEKKVEISADLNKVWNVLIHLHFKRQHQAYFDKDFKKGIPVNFNHLETGGVAAGTLLELHVERLLKYSLFKADTGLVSSLVTFEFQQMHNYTLLGGREEFIKPPDSEEFDLAHVGWQFAMSAFKVYIEGLD